MILKIKKIKQIRKIKIQTVFYFSIKRIIVQKTFNKVEVFMVSIKTLFAGATGVLGIGLLVIGMSCNSSNPVTNNNNTDAQSVAADKSALAITYNKW